MSRSAPSLLALKARASANAFARANKLGYLLLGLLALALMYAGVKGSWQALNFLGTFGDIGLAVFARVLEIGLIVLTSGVAFSATTAAITTLYLSDDLNFLLAQPLPAARVFGLKVFETFLNTALVPLLLTLPVLLTLAAFLGAPVWAYPVIVLTGVTIFAAPVGLGALLAVGLMRAAPAGRVRDVATGLGVVFSAGLVFAVRAMRPETILNRLQNPEDFARVLSEFAGPTNPLLPPSWAAQGVWQAARGEMPLALVPLLALTAGLLALATWLAGKAYQEGWARALDSSTPKLDPRPRGPSAGERWLGRLGPAGTLAYKDWRLILRDPTQWSQLLVVVALAGVYLISVQGVPLPYPQFREILGYLQLVFQGFIVGAVAVRLSFPAVSLEGRAFWLLRTGPITARQLVLSKFLSLLPVTLLLSVGLAVASGRIMAVGPAVMLVGLLLAVSNALVITALGTGMGAANPRFTADNPAEIGVSPAGLGFMGLSLLYAAGSAALLGKAAIGSILRPDLFSGFSALWSLEGVLGLSALLLLTVFGTWGALRFGWRGLERWE
ncbi:putative ABC transporter permease subunit [Deinococcus sp. Marseille-Q6407]|uniref:putative ABC transporter permease subunit n=1 Tax=Deinococcus sp. Marseille-Q6407 TaxID=2969223 RepID=UPI0021BFB67B|nr:hypothetical protein [Deinococcus sp. Marseille-Q6407]